MPAPLCVVCPAALLVFARGAGARYRDSLRSRRARRLGRGEVSRRGAGPTAQGTVMTIRQPALPTTDNARLYDCVVLVMDRRTVLYMHAKESKSRAKVHRAATPKK